jgi:hypothetical protein
MEKTELPGQKWYRGFFSMGSAAIEIIDPYVRV